MSSMVRFSSVTLTCPDPGRLAAFYADITGGEVTFIHKTEWASMRCVGARMEFMGVDDFGRRAGPRTHRWYTSTSTWRPLCKLRSASSGRVRVASRISRIRRTAWCSRVRTDTLSACP